MLKRGLVLMALGHWRTDRLYEAGAEDVIAVWGLEVPVGAATSLELLSTMLRTWLRGCCCATAPPASRFCNLAL